MVLGTIPNTDTEYEPLDATSELCVTSPSFTSDVPTVVSLLRYTLSVHGSAALALPTFVTVNVAVNGCPEPTSVVPAETFDGVKSGPCGALSVCAAAVGMTTAPITAIAAMAAVKFPTYLICALPRGCLRRCRPLKLADRNRGVYRPFGPARGGATHRVSALWPTSSSCASWCKPSVHASRRSPRKGSGKGAGTPSCMRRRKRSCNLRLPRCEDRVVARAVRRDA